MCNCRETQLMFNLVVEMGRKKTVLYFASTALQSLLRKPPVESVNRLPAEQYCTRPVSFLILHFFFTNIAIYLIGRDRVTDYIV